MHRRLPPLARQQQEWARNPSLLGDDREPADQSLDRKEANDSDAGDGSVLLLWLGHLGGTANPHPAVAQARLISHATASTSRRAAFAAARLPPFRLGRPPLFDRANSIPTSRPPRLGQLLPVKRQRALFGPISIEGGERGGEARAPEREKDETFINSSDTTIIWILSTSFETTSKTSWNSLAERY